MSKKWTLKQAWDEFEDLWPGQSQNPDDVELEHVTEADHYMAALALQAAKEPDPIRRAKIMHVGLVYVHPFLNNMPRKKNTDGSYMDRDEQFAYLVSTVTHTYTRWYEELAGCSPSRRLIKKIEQGRFEKISADEWFDIADALDAGDVEDEVILHFYRFARDCWKYLNSPLTRKDS